MHVWASACVAKATSVRPAADDDFVLHNSVLKMTMQYVKFFFEKSCVPKRTSQWYLWE